MTILTPLSLLLCASLAVAGPSVPSQDLDTVPVERLAGLEELVQVAEALEAEVATARASLGDAEDDHDAADDAVGEQRSDLSVLRDETRVAWLARGVSVDEAKATRGLTRGAVQDSRDEVRAARLDLKAARATDDRTGIAEHREALRDARHARGEARVERKLASIEVSTAKTAGDAHIEDARDAVHDKRDAVDGGKALRDEERADVVAAELQLAVLEARHGLALGELELAKARLVHEHGGTVDVVDFEDAVAAAREILVEARRDVVVHRIER